MIGYCSVNKDLIPLAMVFLFLISRLDASREDVDVHIAIQSIIGHATRCACNQ